ncbi:MAG: SCP2 sterol-binding domain-containing protein [Anaerolineaceae bacterium]|nr:SCP2 sterol-binding domain-containing protein [Anaerolineaceae bacterium]
MSVPDNLNLQQTLEGMPLAFDADAAGDLNTTIQFFVSGEESGNYHLCIQDHECFYRKGSAKSAALTIHTPSEIWLKISRGEIDGQEALMQGLYTANGDISLLMKMNTLFKPSSEIRYAAPSGQRPPGPLKISGMAWMTVAFIPWIIHWAVIDIPKINLWISVGLPLLCAGTITVYRLKYDRPTWMEWGGLIYFGITALLSQVGGEGYIRWGSVLSSAGMGMIWLSSLLWAKAPLSAEYSKWGFIQPLWRNGMFTYPNAVISLMWGWQFIMGTCLGIAAILIPAGFLYFIIGRFLLQVPAFIFTSAYQKRVPITKPAFTDRSLQIFAGLGLTFNFILTLWIILKIY